MLSCPTFRKAEEPWASEGLLVGSSARGHTTFRRHPTPGDLTITSAMWKQLNLCSVFEKGCGWRQHRFDHPQQWWKLKLKPEQLLLSNIYFPVSKGLRLIDFTLEQTNFSLWEDSSPTRPASSLLFTQELAALLCNLFWTKLIMLQGAY